MNTKKNLKVFLQQNHLLSNLYLYMVFVESIRPILFACKDEEGGLYIGSCHCATASKCEWILARTTYDRLIELLTDKITIRDVFVQDNTDAYVVTLHAESDKAEIKKQSLLVIDNILPTAGYYMEAEADEFEEELAELQNAKESEEFMSVNMQGSFNTMFRSFVVQISVPEPKVTGYTTGYLLSSSQTLRCAV